MTRKFSSGFVASIRSIAASTSSRGDTSRARTCAARASASCTSDGLAGDVPDGALRADVPRVAERTQHGHRAADLLARRNARSTVPPSPARRRSRTFAPPGSEARCDFRHVAGSSGYKARPPARRSRTTAGRFRRADRSSPTAVRRAPSATIRPAMSPRARLRAAPCWLPASVSVPPILASSSRARSRRDRVRG